MHPLFFFSVVYFLSPAVFLPRSSRDSVVDEEETDACSISQVGPRFAEPGSFEFEYGQKVRFYHNSK